MLFKQVKTYVIDFKQFSKIADTKKAGCGDRLFSGLVIQQREEPLTFIE
ncbi:hypothetical protein ACUULL_003268 [Vibrio cholerae]